MMNMRRRTKRQVHTTYLVSLPGRRGPLFGQGDTIMVENEVQGHDTAAQVAVSERAHKLGGRRTRIGRVNKRQDGLLRLEGIGPDIPVLDGAERQFGRGRRVEPLNVTQVTRGEACRYYTSVSRPVRRCD